jgi:hypothetical protein
MYNSFGELPGFTAVNQNGLHVGVEDSYFSVVGIRRSARSYATVKNWVAQFKRGDFSHFLFFLVGLRTYKHPGKWYVVRDWHSCHEVSTETRFFSQIKSYGATRIVKI